MFVYDDVAKFRQAKRAFRLLAFLNEKEVEIMADLQWRFAWRLQILLVSIVLFFARPGAHSQNQNPKFRVVVLAEAGGIQRPFVDAEIVWLRSESVKENFAINYIETTAPVNEAFLAKYKLSIQLNYPPYGWTPAAMDAFKKYIEEGQGGWIGFHHAMLLGEFDGYPMWSRFSQFMDGIRFTNYIPKFATARVLVEEIKHPALKGVPPSFVIENEEWYTYDKSPRADVHVLATVDESAYSPEIKAKMKGDHPVIWCNELVKARNIHIFMGHHPELFENPAFTKIFSNSILWAANQ